MTKYNLNEFGKRLKKVRKSKQMTQREFADKLGLSKSFICDIELGGSKAGFDFFYNISSVFNVNLDYLVHGKGGMFRGKPLTQNFEHIEIGSPIESVEVLIWLMERSPLMLHSVLGFANKLQYDNAEHIRKELQLYKTKKEKKND